MCFVKVLFKSSPSKADTTQRQHDLHAALPCYARRRIRLRVLRNKAVN